VESHQKFLISPFEGLERKATIFQSIIEEWNGKNFCIHALTRTCGLIKFACVSTRKLQFGRNLELR